MKPRPLPHITPIQARERGYRPITNEINPRTETTLILSIERAMAGADAVWIDYGTYLELGRHRQDIRLEQ